jgi:hypothetical protein
VGRWGPNRAYLFPLRSGRDDRWWLIERRRSTAPTPIRLPSGIITARRRVIMVLSRARVITRSLRRLM